MTASFSSTPGRAEMIVAIDSVNLTERLATGVNPQAGQVVVRFGAMPGGIYNIPEVGEQWVVAGYGPQWRLLHKAAYQDPRLNIPAQEGMTVVGRGGPTHVVGSEVRLPASIFLGDWELNVDPASGALRVRRGDGDWTVIGA